MVIIDSLKRKCFNNLFSEKKSRAIFSCAKNLYKKERERSPSFSSSFSFITDGGGGDVPGMAYVELVVVVVQD